MEAELLDKYAWFHDRVNNDPVAAAILTLASVLAPQPKRTGLTTHEAAEYLGVSRCTVIKLCKEGRLRKQQLGTRSIRFNTNDLDAVKTKPKPGTADPHQRHFA